MKRAASTTGTFRTPIKIDTPDPYLDLGLAAQILGQDGAWHDPCFTHGPWSWSSPYAGWRICYGPTVLGWHNRVQSSTAEFFKDQAKQPEYPSPVWKGPGGYASGHVCRGAVPDLARNRSYFYNMGEVLVDHMLYDWEWTGDLPFMTRAFDFIADKLLWEERCLDPDGDGLYENWLNTWVSDAHWYNGSGCIQASVYNWRANQLMADIAQRLGKDPSLFQARAAKIKRACERLLWAPHEGVYAEYRDALGHQRPHTAPEQASIYHPIDFRFCDEHPKLPDAALQRVCDQERSGNRAAGRASRLVLELAAPLVFQPWALSARDDQLAALLLPPRPGGQGRRAAEGDRGQFLHGPVSGRHRSQSAPRRHAPWFDGLHRYDFDVHSDGGGGSLRRADECAGGSRDRAAVLPTRLGPRVDSGRRHRLRVQLGWYDGAASHPHSQTTGVPGPPHGPHSPRRFRAAERR